MIDRPYTETYMMTFKSDFPKRIGNKIPRIYVYRWMVARGFVAQSVIEERMHADVVETINARQSLRQYNAAKQRERRVTSK